VGAGGVAVVVGIAAVVASVVHTELLRASFQRQVWAQARVDSAQLVGADEQFGRLVESPDLGAHCDFVATGVYGTGDDFETVEASYAAHTVAVGSQPPVAFSVVPASDAALSGTPPRSGTADERVYDALVRTRVDLAQARTFPTVYVVEVISWGHPPWLDWRCR
jgi:hypothetical protein